MNNEETILDPQSFADSNASKSNAPADNTTDSNTYGKNDAKAAKGSSTAEKAACAASGFVACAASMVAGNAMASAKKEETSSEDQSQIDPADSPSEHEAIVASDKGLRVAQVDDDKPFNEAFADARAQVGSGGVFEWHGKVYGTFYSSEWEQMSAEERAEWQSKVNYNELRDESEAQQYAHHHNAPQHTTAQEQQPEQTVNENQASQTQDSIVEIADIRQVDVDGDGQKDTVVELNNGVMFADIDHDGEADVAACDVNRDGKISNDEVADVRAEHIVMPQAPNDATYAAQQSSGSNDADVHVIEVGQADLNGDGMAENVALVEIDGTEALLVDIDQDNVVDVIIADLNGNGQIEGNEIGDITGQGVGMPTMSDGDMYMAQADSEPDYTNDADMGLYEA